MQLVHFTAHLRRGCRLFLEPEPAAWMWARLAASFPHTVAASLMPDHPHWLAWVQDLARARQRFARICGHLQRQFDGGRGSLWLPYPDPDPVPRSRAARAARYIELNPCRGTLVAHPLSWMWTTARDHVGAVRDPVLDSAAHARAVGRALSEPTRWLDYLVADERVTDRRPLAPRAPGDQRLPAFALDAIARAAAAACRRPPAAVLQRGPARDLFVALARDQGTRSATDIADHCGLSPRRVGQVASTFDAPGALDAGRRCLGDDRLGENAAPECFAAVSSAA